MTMMIMIMMVINPEGGESRASCWSKAGIKATEKEGRIL